MSAVRRHTITRERPARVDDGRGNKEDDWSNPETADYEGWAIDAGGTAEDLANREGTRVDYVIRGPVSADIRARDRIILLGETYRIEGRPVVQPGVTPATTHQIVKLSAWEG